MLKNFTLNIKTFKSSETIDITPQVSSFVFKNHINNGFCHLFTTHTTCCLTTGEIGEGTAEDFVEVAQKIIPDINFRHAHNPSHAWSHMASSFIGASLTIPIKDGKLTLGTWQSIILVELDGPRERNIIVTLTTD